MLEQPTSEPLLVLVLADTIVRGQLLIESRWRGLVTAVRRAEGVYLAGSSTVLVITPRTQQGLRGLTVTDVYIDSYRAYNAIREALAPCLLAAEGGGRWFDETGQLPEQP
ncbi:hypothetical protein [Lentzea sp. NPDC059081]|uniref:hypothetical protein n=1 Tax=Lentzea sp. NPDC059081 TaxID=3346719 RepID=UPI003674D796